MFLEIIRKLKLEFTSLSFLSTTRVIDLIGTEKSCPILVEINSNSIDGQTRPYVYMYVCIYVCMYVCIYVYVYVCIYVYINDVHIYIPGDGVRGRLVAPLHALHICKYAYVYICIYVCMYI